MSRPDARRAARNQVAPRSEVRGHARRPSKHSRKSRRLLWSNLDFYKGRRVASFSSLFYPGADFQVIAEKSDGSKLLAKIGSSIKTFAYDDGEEETVTTIYEILYFKQINFQGVVEYQGPPDAVEAVNT